MAALGDEERERRGEEKKGGWGWERGKRPFLARCTGGVSRDVQELGKEAEREGKSKQSPRPHTTLAAGVCEVGEERRDCGLSSANYIHPPAPLPCHELLRLHALHTAPGFRAPRSHCCTSRYLIILRLLINIHSLRAWEPLSGCCLVFMTTRSNITWLGGALTQARPNLLCLYAAAAPTNDLQ